MNVKSTISDVFISMALLHKAGSGDDNKAASLLTITEDCRPDMHEPDEQGVSATITGDHLDNAGCGPEYIVNLLRESEGMRKAQACSVNLATLIAYARIGAVFCVASEAVERVASGNKYARGRKVI